MTVGELMEQLKGYPSDLVVTILLSYVQLTPTLGSGMTAFLETVRVVDGGPRSVIELAGPR